MPYLTTSQIIELRDQLANAFNSEEFNELAAVSVDLNVAKEIAPGAFNTQLRHAIEWCERRGVTIRLLAAAERQRPQHQGLLKFLNQFKSALIGETAATLTPALSVDQFAYQLQKVVRPELPFADVALWRNRLEKAERAVCRVELTQGTGEGTGFLVAKDLVLTCYHVIETLVGASTKTIADVVLRFDYKRNVDNTQIHDREYRLTPEWLTASSPTTELDYALLRVAGEPGSEQIGAAPPRESRGCLRLSTAVPAIGHPLQILQHPKTLPMKLAFGAVVALAGHFINYDTNTNGGSSGSPVFTADWKVVALHDAGGANSNRGIKCRDIVADLESKQLAGVLNS